MAELKTRDMNQLKTQHQKCILSTKDNRDEQEVRAWIHGERWKHPCTQPERESENINWINWLLTRGQSTWWGPLGMGRWVKPLLTGNEAILAAVTKADTVASLQKAYPINADIWFGTVPISHECLYCWLHGGVFQYFQSWLWTVMSELKPNTLPNMWKLLPEWICQNKNITTQV